MKLKCPNCQKSLKIPDRMAGRKAKCLGCQHSWVLPELTSDSMDVSAAENSVPSEPDDLPKRPISKERANEAEANGITVSRRRDSATQANQQAEMPMTEWQEYTTNERLQATITWLIKQTTRLAILVKDEAKHEVTFYRLHYAEFWKQVLSGPIRLRWGDDALPSSREMFIPDFEKGNSGWRVDLPSRCVRCGAKTTEPEQTEKRTLVDFHASQLIWVALAIALILLVWRPTIVFIHFGFFKTLLLAIAAIVAIFRFRRQETAQISFRRCKDHATIIQFPRLFIVAGGLIVRLGSEKARQWLSGTRQEDYNGPPVPVGNESDCPIPPPIFDADQATNSALMQASTLSKPMTIAMVDDLESTPIVHSENTLGLTSPGHIPFSTDLLFGSYETGDSEKPRTLPKLSPAEVSVAHNGLSSISSSNRLNDEILEGIPVDDDPRYASADELPQLSTPPEPAENPFFPKHPKLVNRQPGSSDLDDDRDSYQVNRISSLRNFISNLFIVMVLLTIIAGVAIYVFPEEAQQFRSWAETKLKTLTDQSTRTP